MYTIKRPIKLKPNQCAAAIELLIQCVEQSQNVMAQVFNDPENLANAKLVGVVFNDNKNILALIKKKLK